MADNYIERQQEQYEARKAAWKQAQKYGKKKSTTVHPVKSASCTPMASKPETSPKRVFITGGAEGIGKAIVEAFCLSGDQVAFCDINETAGQETAKATGSILTSFLLKNRKKKLKSSPHFFRCCHHIPPSLRLTVWDSTFLT